MTLRPIESVGDWPLEYREYFRLFNEGDYFEAHEVLEDLWAIEAPPLRDYYKGLIQAAVAICHWERGNPSGALKLHRSAARYLCDYPDDYEGFALREFQAAMDQLFAPLENGGGALNRELVPCLKLKDYPV